MQEKKLSNTLSPSSTPSDHTFIYTHIIRHITIYFITYSARYYASKRWLKCTTLIVTWKIIKYFLLHKFYSDLKSLLLFDVIIDNKKIYRCIISKTFSWIKKYFIFFALNWLFKCLIIQFVIFIKYFFGIRFQCLTIIDFYYVTVL